MPGPRVPFQALLPIYVALLLPAAGLCDDQIPEQREQAALGETPAPLMALPLGEAPGATTVITAEEIARSGAANIFELLRRVPGVDIRYTPMGGHIGIRSTGASPFSEEVLLLIDGTPYNSPDKGGFPGHPNYRGFFPLDRIERIEIIRGAISVLYGANAFGGVVNIVSKRAADAVEDTVEGTAFGTTILVGERDTFERKLRAAIVKSGWDASLEVAGSDSETPVNLNEGADHRRVDIYGAAQRGRFSMAILHQQNVNGSFDFLGTDTRRARHDVDILDMKYTRNVGGFALRGSASVNRYEGTTCAVCHNNQTLEPDNAITHEVGDERTVDTRYHVSLHADRTITDSQDLTFGFEANQDSVRRDIVEVPDAPSRLSSGGVYLQHQWHLFDRSLHILSGVRHDQAEDLTGATSPRLAIVAEPNENLVFRASWSRAYRAPTWNERYILQRILPEPVAPNTIVVSYGNEDLRRERNDSAEAGVSWRAAPWMVARCDLYYNKIHRFIQRGSLGFVFGFPSEIQLQYANRPDDFAVRGGEVSLLFQPTRTVSVNVGYAYRDLTIGWDDAHAAYAPRNRASLTAAWMLDSGWTFDTAGSYSSRYTVSNPGTYGVRPQPAYQLWDAAVRYRFTGAGTSWSKDADFSVGLVGRNLFDKHPRESMNNPGIDTTLRGRALLLEFRADF